jgi:hypothetical protein
MGTVSYGGNARSSVGGVKLDPRMADVIATAAAASPYNVKIISEVRPKGGTAKGNHDNGYAVDVQLQDPQTGNWLPNTGKALGGAKAYSAYESFAQTARVVQQQKYPELNRTFRWGGGFKQGGTPFDMMHFDITPSAGGKMAYYDWATGITGPGKAALPGAKSNGGLGNPQVLSQAESALAGHPVPPADVGSAPALPSALTDKFLTGDGGLGYGVAPAPLPADLASLRANAAPPIPAFSPSLSTRGEPVPALSPLSYRGAVPPIPQGDPRSASPAIAATGLTLPSTAPPLPAGYASSGLNEAQRNAMLAMPAAPTQITNAADAAKFYSGFGLQPDLTAAIHPATVGDRAAELAATTASPATPPPITDQASAGSFYNGFGLAPPATPADAIARAIGISPASASDALPYAPTDMPSASGAPPIPMDRLRVTPDEASSDALDAINALVKGTAVNLDAVPPAQQLALAQAVPTLMQLQNDPKAALSYLQSTGLYDPLMKVVPTHTPSFTERMGAGLSGLTLPPRLPDPVNSWGIANLAGLGGNISNILSTAADAYRRPISASDGATAPSTSGLSWAAPYLSTPAAKSSSSSASSAPGTDWAAPYYSGASASPSPQPALPSTNNGWGYLAPPSPASSQSIQDGMLDAMGSSYGVPDAAIPKYIDAVRYEKIPSTQPIEQGSGVHWDDAQQNYILDAPTPAKTTYTTKAVTYQKLNPAYVAPVAQTVPAPVAPLSPQQSELAALRAQQMNPLQSAFASTPLGRLFSFGNTMLNGASYGAPQQGGLLSMLSPFAQGIGGLGGLLNTPATPGTPIPITAKQAANQSPEALAAIKAGQTSYSAPNGLLMPVYAMNGQVANSSGMGGGGSPYASNGSLSSTHF